MDKQDSLDFVLILYAELISLLARSYASVPMRVGLFREEM